MSTAFESSLPVRAAKQSIAHPLAPIDATEIKQAVSFVRSQWPTDTDLHFKCITLQEPAKKEVVPYLEAEVSGGALPQIDRRVLVTYYIRRTVSHYLDLRTNSLLTYWLEQIPRGCRQLDHRDTRV
jgi:primary-amine oxidase